MTAQRALAIAALILAVLSVTGAATFPALAGAVILLAIALLV